MRFGFNAGAKGNNPLSFITNIISPRRNSGINNTPRPRGYQVNVLPIEEAYRRIKLGNCFLLDVRTEMEYGTIRIKGSINIPLDKLYEQLPNIVSNKSECIIIYCATGSRVRRAIQILWNLGYTNLYIWEGGGLNTFAFQDLIVYNNAGMNRMDSSENIENMK